VSSALAFASPQQTLLQTRKNQCMQIISQGRLLTVQLLTNIYSYAQSAFCFQNLGGDMF